MTVFDSAPDWRVSVAPMLDWTDRHCRYLHRLLSRRARLYTEMVRAIRPDVLEKIVATIPVKRLGTPDEIGSIVTWLAGDDSGFTTGADFACNGGLHMG